MRRTTVLAAEKQLIADDSDTVARGRAGRCLSAGLRSVLTGRDIDDHRAPQFIDALAAVEVELFSVNFCKAVQVIPDGVAVRGALAFMNGETNPEKHQRDNDASTERLAIDTHLISPYEPVTAPEA
jgi:hypothetical protein